jgi:hypothetical protein
MAWNPAPVIGSAFWGGNPQLVTTRQFISSISSINYSLSTNNSANTAKFSTLYVSTITSIDEQSPLNIKNLSSIRISTFGNYTQDSDNVLITTKRNSYNYLNGTYVLQNKDFPNNVYNPVINNTDLLTGSGSFQALTGALTIAATISTLNLYAGNDGINISGNARFLTGSLDMCNHSIRNADGLSSLTVSTGTLKAGVASLNQLGVSGTTSLSNTLNMNNNNITTAATIGATTLNATAVNATNGTFVNIGGTLTGNSSGTHTGQQNGNVTGNIQNDTLTVSGKYSITETADVGSAFGDYGNYGTVNITGKGGLGGIVNITADVATPLNPAFTVSQLTMEAKGNYGNFVITPPDPYLGYVPRGGLVSIIAREGLSPTFPATVTSGLFANGEIDLTAYSFNTGAGIVPGLIKLASGANAMYAGSISPLTGVFGNNYIYGQYGNTITAGLPGGGIPNTPGENYIYGYSGTVIQNGLYVDSIYNKYGGDLNIDGRTCNVNITAGGSITVSGNVSINDNLNMTNGNITNVASITMSNNGLLNMSNGGLTNVSTMSGPVGSNIMIKNDENFIFLPSPDTAEATGGTVTRSGYRTFHTFTTDGTFTLNVPVGTVEVMLIGGGGGGGGTSGGGGGSGGMIIVTSTLSPGSFTVTIGNGGAGGDNATNGGSGSQSRFSATGINIRALGGGGGSTEGVAVGGTGGSGGGGSGLTESNGGAAGTNVTTGMTVVSSSAYAGGTNPGPGNAGSAGCGGGGSFSAGGAVSAAAPSDGGDGGLATLYYGTYYGGGGGGSAAPSGTYGTPHKGRGGGTSPFTSGGNGSQGASSTQAGAGVANTGGGGGGGEGAGYSGAAGGSGVVIISYTTILPQFTIGTVNQMYLSSSLVTIGADLTILGNTNIQTTSVTNINTVTITTTGEAAFDGPSTIITGQLLGQNEKPIAIVIGVATGFWNPGFIGTVTTSGAASFSNADNPLGFPVATFNAYMSLLAFNNLNATDFFLSDQRIQQNSTGTYWSADCDAIAYSPNAYGTHQNVQWTVNAIFIPKSLS